MARAKSGRVAACYIPNGALQRSGWIKGTWDATNSRATFGTSGSDFWYHSDKYEVELRLNGVVTVPIDWITPKASNSVLIKAFTYQIAGTQYTFTSTSVGTLTPSTSTGKRFVYAICVSAGGVYKIATSLGAASTTRGAAGGPAFISTNGVLCCYVVRSYGATAIPIQNEITYTLFDGTEWVNPQNNTNFRPLLMRVDFNALPAAIHTGTLRPHVYARAYSFANNFTKAGQFIDWKTGITGEREDATEQGATRKQSDIGRRGHSFSANKFVSALPDEVFSNQNADNSTDLIVKMFQDNTQSAKYMVAQVGLAIDLDLPNADKQKASITGEVNGHIEEIG